MITLYRAANSTDMERGTCSFSEDLATARAYTDNPSFGGSTLYVLDVEIADGEMLDLVDGRTPRWLRDHVEAMGAVALSQALTAPWTRTYRLLLERGIRWVRFQDDYPEGAVTIARVVDGDDSDDAITEAMRPVE